MDKTSEVEISKALETIYPKEEMVFEHYHIRGGLLETLVRNTQEGVYEVAIYTNEDMEKDIFLAKYLKASQEGVAIKDEDGTFIVDLTKKE